MIIQVWNGVSQRLLSLTLMGLTLSGLASSMDVLPSFVFLYKVLDRLPLGFASLVFVWVNHASAHESSDGIIEKVNSCLEGVEKWQSSLEEELPEK